MCVVLVVCMVLRRVFGCLRFVIVRFFSGWSCLIFGLFRVCMLMVII